MRFSSNGAIDRRAVLGVAVFLLATTCAVAQCTGVPTFMPPAILSPAGGAITAIDNADFDGDGDLDLVLCNGAQIVICRNYISAFAPEPPVASPSNILDVAVGDFNSDGIPDVAGIGTLVMPIGSVQTLQGRVVIFLTTGSAQVITFATPVVYPFGPQVQGGSIGRAIRVADMNGDGILDIVAIDQNSGNVWILPGQGSLGLGNGTFGAPVPNAAGVSATDAAVADFNQDGALDVALVSYGGSTAATQATVLAGVLGPGGTPTGTLVPVSTIPIPGPSGALNIEAVDVNADGYRDLVVANLQTIVVAYGGGGLTFVPTVYPGGYYPEQVAIGDFSGDGLLDIAVARDANIGSSFGNFSMLVSNGGGYTGYTTLAVNPGLPRCITAGDFNLDGILDLAVGKSVNGIDVLYGTCAPGVARAVNLSTPNGGEVLPVGGTTLVTWTKSTSVGTVDLDVSRDNGMTWAPVARMLSGLSASWHVAPPGSNLGVLRVTASGYPQVSDVSNAPFSIAGPGAAAAVPIGTGCSTIGQPPALVIGPPILGTTASITVSSFSGPRPGGLFASPIPPFPTPVYPGCTVELDVLQLVQVAAFSTDAAGLWSAAATLPALPALAGLAFRAQAALVLPVAPGYALTNAVDLAVGF